MSHVATHNPSQVARSGAVYTLALVFQKILSFGYFTLVARALGPENLGTYVFALSFAAFFSLAADFGFAPMAIRDFSQNPDAQAKHFRQFLGIRLVMLALALGLLFGAAFALGYDSTLLKLISITAVIMSMDVFTSYFYTIFRARQNLFYEAIGTAVFQIIIFAVGYYTITRTQDLASLLFVIFLGSIWHLIFTFSLLKRKIKINLRPEFDWTVFKLWIGRAIPFFLAAGFIKAYNTIDSILIKNLEGDEAVGLYAIPAKVVFTFPFIALAVTAAVYPAMSNYAKHAPERLHSLFTRTLRLLLTISLPIAAGIFLLADPIIMRIWPDFARSIPALKILIWAVVFLYIEYPFGSLLNATGHERRNTINRGLQLAAFVVLNIILIPIYGFMGAVYASLATSVLIVFLGWLKVRDLVTVIDKQNLVVLLKLGIAVFAMSEFVNWAAPRLSFLTIIPLAALIYLLMIIALGVYGREDWAWVRGILKK